MESRVRKPDVVHLPLPISIEEKREHINSDRLSYRSPTINQHATLIQGTRLGVVADPAQAHSLRILASPDTEVDGEAGLTSRPIFISRPLLQARVGLSTHISGGTMLPGAPAQVVRGAQGRGPLESISPCCALHSFYDCLLGESRVHVGQGQPLCKWVSPSAPFPSQRWGPRRDCPPRVGPRPGSAWLTELSSTRLV